jgi:hypothetical protein
MRKCQKINKKHLLFDDWPFFPEIGGKTIAVRANPATAFAACVGINNWTDPAPASEHTVTINEVRDYQPGQFYLRELLCIEAVLAKLPTPDTSKSCAAVQDTKHTHQVTL